MEIARKRHERVSARAYPSERVCLGALQWQTESLRHERNSEKRRRHGANSFEQNLWPLLEPSVRDRLATYGTPPISHYNHLVVAEHRVYAPGEEATW